MILDYNYNEEIVNKIIIKLEKELTNKNNALNKAIKIDSEKSRFHTELSMLRKHLTVAKEAEDLIKSTKNYMTDGLGNIAVIYDGNPYVTITLAIYALKTHNNIVFHIDDNMLAVNTVIVTLIDEIAKQYKYGKNIVSLENSIPKNELIKIQDNYDLLIYVGDKYEYYYFKEKFNITTVYNGYRNVLIYADNAEDFSNLLEEIDNYIFVNSINSDFYDDTNIEDVIDTINRRNVNDCVIILTKDSKKAYELVSKIKAKRIYVNQNPFDNYLFEFDQNLLVINKKIEIGNLKKWTS